MLTVNTASDSKSVHPSEESSSFTVTLTDPSSCTNPGHAGPCRTSAAIRLPDASVTNTLVPAASQRLATADVPSQGVQFHHGPCTAGFGPTRGFPSPSSVSDLRSHWSAFPGGVTRSIWHLNPILPMNAHRVVPFVPFGLLARLATVLALLLWVATSAKAGRPQAENILFGTVWAEGRAVISTNLVIEARRGDVGPVVARYRLGDDPGAGDLFFLRIQRETAPAMSPVTVDANEPLTVVVSLEGRPSFRTRIQLPPPGRCLRLDFGRNGGEIVATVVDHLPVPVATRPAPRPTPKPAKPDATRTAALAAAVMPVIERRWVMR